MTDRRTQAMRSAETRAALIAAARPLFAAHGYSAVGTETIVRTAGVTRGALYYHFADKVELFAAVFEAVEAEVSQRIGEAVAAADQSDPLVVMRLGANTWLDACAEPEIHQIVLVDAPAVLGWARWTEIGNRYNIGLVRALLAHAIEVGRIPPQPLDATAHTLLGALREAALYLARADDHEQARRDTGAVIERLIQALAVG
ncbi:MAG TPA: TetR family transcriptional regulator [Mycobacterium sp.]|uniref:TetR/AcrR family transcriptional regulator n=1 Tax=Mycobacterium sp. TaxID=1785 RepID=UPI002D70C264|nr:TetR family transcriptional regulator [Mycobacterium sp.]HZU47747.1 TetR family transcriptional regulator [Mycobacterium sp.]